MGSSCIRKDTHPEDKPPQLPPETQSGPNVFVCLENEQEWLHEVCGLLPNIFSDYGNESSLIWNVFKLKEYENNNIVISCFVH